MNWRAAALQQLRMIVWDTGAHPVLRQEAAAELSRRRRLIYGKINFKVRKVYPR